MPDYSKGKIYRIVDMDSGKQYVGSTTVGLSQRLAQHVSDYKRYVKGNTKYVSSYIILELDDYDIVLIEEYPCDNKEQLHQREAYYQGQLDCVNCIKAYVTEEELKQTKAEYMIEYNKKYVETHSEHVKEYHKQYQVDNKETLKQYKSEKHLCDCGHYFTIPHKNRHLKSLKHTNFHI